MKVEEIMTKYVVTVRPETKISEVAKLMFTNRFHGLPVVEGGKVRGIITETDFFVKDSDNFFLPTYIKMLDEMKIYEISKDKEDSIKELLETEAKDIMTERCVTIFKDMDVDDLVKFFKETKFATLPVVDADGKLIGIVTLSDVLRLIKI